MLTFFHAPQSRSTRILWFLEELGEPYEVKRVNIRRADGSGGADESYRSVHPHLKVPAVIHDGQTLIESAAICIYLADAFPKAGLAPQIGEPERAAYIRWMVYFAAVFEPGLSGTFNKWPNMAQAIGSFDETLKHVEETLSNHPYIVGSRFTAADVMLATGIHFGTNVMKVIPPSATFGEYVGRCASRPAFQRAMAKDSG